LGDQFEFGVGEADGVALGCYRVRGRGVWVDCLWVGEDLLSFLCQSSVTDRDILQSVFNGLIQPPVCFSKRYIALDEENSDSHEPVDGGAGA
jgi:hypothetical protein